MQKQIFMALLAIFLVGCSQAAQETASGNKEDIDQSTTAQSTQDTDDEAIKKNAPKEIEPKDIYQGVFDQKAAPIKPEKMTIDSIGVDASIENVGTEDNGEMGVPKDYKNLGWLSSGTKPGEQGNAVIDGHVTDPEGEGVFWDLDKLKSGDEITVSGENDEALVFIVTDMQAFDLGEAPIRDIFGYTSRRALNLITCTGDFDHDQGTHDQRLVVYTELKKD